MAGARATWPGRRAYAVLALLLVLLAAGVVWSRLNDGGGGSSLGGVAVGEPAPEFSLRTLDGDTVGLSSLRGRPVWLNFWATWCAPCKAEIPAMLAVSGEAGPGGVQLVAVNMAEEGADVERYLDANGFRALRTVLDEDGGVSASYGVSGLPTHVFIDARGRVRRVERRALDAAEMRAALESLD